MKLLVYRSCVTGLLAKVQSYDRLLGARMKDGESYEEAVKSIDASIEEWNKQCESIWVVSIVEIIDSKICEVINFLMVKQDILKDDIEHGLKKFLQGF